MSHAERFRVVPKVDQLLLDPELDAFRGYPQAVLLRHVQEEVAALRARLQADESTEVPSSRDEATRWVLRRLRESLRTLGSSTMCRVLNATGVVLHTNLGRAPLSKRALEAVVDTAIGYSNLEYDLPSGKRASRMRHVESLLRHLTGAEAAFAVNNNAAAVLLAIGTLGRAGVVISRGEQVEIGGSFRLPDILAGAGVPIHEVGTTNRTAVKDYVDAATTPGFVFLKVHRSNFTVHGYTQEASIAELAEAAHGCGATVIYDLGSGSLTDFAKQGLPGEPEVVESIAAGADVVTMSGDKLLGGPQAGILAGRQEAMARMRSNPLSRALRIDKLTLAALQATLLSYVETGAREVPIRRLILSPIDEIQQRAERLQERLQGQVEAELQIEVGRAAVGGGTFADLELPSVAVSVRPRHIRATELLYRLRTGSPAVVARIKADVVGLDMRCIADDEVESLANAVIDALATRGGVR
jgi:L-seryl-tRNA(Ser) seleniumtransferase